MQWPILKSKTEMIYQFKPRLTPKKSPMSCFGIGRIYISTRASVKALWSLQKECKRIF